MIRTAILAASAAAILCTLDACTPNQLTPVPAVTGAAPAVTASAPPTTSPLTPASVCQDIAAVQQAPDAAAQLNSIDEHSALGVLWAQAKSGCPGGVPAAGVNPTWTQEVWAMVKAAIPQVLPTLLPVVLSLV
jgi:hypothetical protein